MPACTTCVLCDHGGTLEQAQDVAAIPCNVRRFGHERFTLWRCIGCGSLHCAEDADLPRYYAGYPLQQQAVTLHERIGYANRLEMLHRQGVTANDRILDYGCGAGLFVDFLRQRGLAHAHGYDPFVAKYADAGALRDPFDVVVSYDVIEHDDDPCAFLARVAALVRPGGLLVIGTPNAANVSLARATDPSLHVPYHRHILSERALVGLAAEQGLEVCHLSRRSFYDSPIPTVNSRFMWAYLARCGALDAVNEPPRPGLVWSSPALLFAAFFGYFLPRGDNMLVTFRRQGTPNGALAAPAIDRCLANR